MIVVFVVDTSPTMNVSASGGLSRLDMAKMFVEHLTKSIRKRERVSNQSLLNLGLGGTPDKFLLLSTSQQYEETSTCAAGGRLLVGFGESEEAGNLHPHVESKFHEELKKLKAAQVDPALEDFPETAGGADGLNTALSVGLQLLSRYRLINPATENWAQGRHLCNSSILSSGAPAQTAIQSAILVLVTDGACLRSTKKQGGGSLSLQYGAQPLRELYKEPFRWDQRIFCIGVGAKEGAQTSQFLHPQLRALCGETGGSFYVVSRAQDLTAVASNAMKRIAPPLPRQIPIDDPLYTKLGTTIFSASETINVSPNQTFVDGGPICCFQCIEPAESGKPSPRLKASMLYCGSQATMNAEVVSQPLWVIPEHFFPSKKLDSLPPRQAHPLLMFSKHPVNLGSKSFEPQKVIKMLHHLDQLILSNRKALSQPVKLLHRDVYVCEWLNPETGKAVTVSLGSRHDCFPVFVPGSGRGFDSEASLLNIGILHASETTSTLASSANPSKLATLTMLPPDIHILLPLLIRAAEAEHRAIKRHDPSNKAKLTVALDDAWRNEFRAYIFRLPPYYQYSIRRALRSVLPLSVHSLLATESLEAIPLLCYSKICHQKIRSGEQVARENLERLERMESSILRRTPQVEQAEKKVRYGQYHPRVSVDSYLAALRTLPAPKANEVEPIPPNQSGEVSTLDALGDLPSRCLIAFYESRRRWLFGGQSLCTQGLHADGIYNGGNNFQRSHGNPKNEEKCLLAMADCGVSMMNETSTSRMGDYRERLLFSRPPVVGYGSNDCSGVAATTGIDGSPTISVDDDALPLAFFDPKTGEFSDSMQNRVTSRLLVNFGNPFKEMRGDSVVPEKFRSQSPSNSRLSASTDPSAPDSPPHDSFDSVEEDEALFVRSPTRSSPKRSADTFDVDDEANPSKRLKVGDHPDSSPGPAPPKKPAPPKMDQKPPAVLPAKPLPPPKVMPPVKPPPPRPPSKPTHSSPSLGPVKAPPQVQVQAPTLSNQSAAPQSVTNEETLQNPDAKPVVNLPAGWMCVWSKSQKRWYFFNTKTNQSVWQWPPPT